MHNDKEIPGISLEACKTACLTEKAFKCVSVDYRLKPARCFMSKTSIKEAQQKNMLRKNDNYNLYALGKHITV